MDWDLPSTLRITCARGLAPWLRGELEALGYAPGEGAETGVEVEGTLRDALRLNLELRTAYHVLYHLRTFPCDSGEDLYAGVRAIPWEDVLPADGYVSVASRVDHPTVTSSMWPNLKVKDALVDRLREARGRRPDTGPRRDGAVVTLHWRGREARVYLDTSGVKLADRGYRRTPHRAPLRETLAAGILLATGYTGEQPLVNPMCGSGTLAIEAALLGSDRAPGLLRPGFGALHLLGFDREAWDALRGELRRRSRGRRPAPIVASDHDPAALAAARRNARTAGVDHLIELQECDFAETRVPDGEGTQVILNPEYGERLGGDDLAATYRRIGDFFKQRCQGATGWVFTGNRALGKRVGLRPSRKVAFYNGKLECRLMRYLVFPGRHETGAEEAEAEE